MRYWQDLFFRREVFGSQHETAPRLKPATANSANRARSCLLQLPAVSFAESVSGFGSVFVSCVNEVASIIVLKVTRSHRFSWVDRLAEDSASLNSPSRSASPSSPARQEVAPNHRVLPSAPPRRMYPG